MPVIWRVRWLGDFYHSNDSASTDYLQKIEELENSKQFQDAIGLIREQMKKQSSVECFAIFYYLRHTVSHFIAFCSYSFDPFSCWFVLLAKQYKNEKPCLGDRSVRTMRSSWWYPPVLKEVFLRLDQRGRFHPFWSSHAFMSSVDWCFKELSFHDDKELTVLEISMPIIRRLVTGHLMDIWDGIMEATDFLDKCSLYVYRSISRVIFGWFRPRNPFF